MAQRKYLTPAPFSTGGMLLAGATFLGLTFLPANFDYRPFAGLLFLNGIGMGLFSSPNTSSIMSSVPPEHRGVGSGMRATLQNSGMLLSMAVFFTIVIVGLSGHPPASLFAGLTHAGLPAAPARAVSHLPPKAALFATFLGYNPMGHLLPHGVITHLPASTQAHLFGHSFFPNLIPPPFMDGLRDAFYVSAAMALVAAVASLMRGKQYFHDENAVGARSTQLHDRSSALSSQPAGRAAGSSSARRPQRARPLTDRPGE